VDCPNCKEPLAEGARFCPACGHAVAATGHGTDADPTAVVAPRDATAVVDRPNATAVAGPVTGVTGALRNCSACGADNSAGRLLCARCGADLETGRRPGAVPVVHHPGPAEDVAGEVATPSSRWTARTVLIVVAILAIGGAVGMVVGLVLSDTGGSTDVAAPVFDPAVYPGEPQQLEVTGVGASSERPPAGDLDYGAANLVDRDITTAWSHDPAVEAAADVDLAIALGEPAWVTALTFANGAQSDDLAFTADGRVLRLRLLVAGDAAAELQLLDQPGLQRVELPSPVLVQTVRLVVLEAVAGDTYDEVSLSEIEVIGHPAQGDDRDRLATEQDA
jgi:hypothetical protein